jgi:hypothetical protein
MCSLPVLTIRREPLEWIKRYEVDDASQLDSFPKVQPVGRFACSSEILNLPHIFGTAGFSDRQHSSVR